MGSNTSWLLGRPAHTLIAVFFTGYVGINQGAWEDAKGEKEEQNNTATEF